MGAAVSAGETNDELVDHLVEAGYIRSKNVELLLKAIDRAHFFDAKSRHLAYRDLAWRQNHVHLSAPCIYAEVLEALELPPLRPYVCDEQQEKSISTTKCTEDMSFLNVGSGTLYLSAMVGLALGPHAVHHAIELHADVVQYACDRVREMLHASDVLQQYEVRLPQVVCGNALLLDVSLSSLPPPLLAAIVAAASSGASSAAPQVSATSASASGLLVRSAAAADSASARSRLSSGFGEGDRDSAISQSVEREALTSTPTSTSTSTTCTTSPVALSTTDTLPPAHEPESELLETTSLRPIPVPTSTPQPFLYDRIYCGAAVQQPEHEMLFKRLLKRNGILVMPVRDSLVQVRRVSEDEWLSRDLLSVSFMPLVAPHTRPPPSGPGFGPGPDTEQHIVAQEAADEEPDPNEASTLARNPPIDRPITLPAAMPASLQQLSRMTIRACLRRQIISTLPPLPPSTVELRATRLAGEQRQQEEEAPGAAEQSPARTNSSGNQQHQSGRSWFSIGGSSSSTSTTAGSGSGQSGVGVALSSFANFVGARLGLLGGGGGHRSQRAPSSTRAAGGFAPVDPNPDETAQRPDRRRPLFLHYSSQSRRHRHRHARRSGDRATSPQHLQPQPQQVNLLPSGSSATDAAKSSSASASGSSVQQTPKAPSNAKRSSGLSHWQWLPWSSSSRSSTAASASGSSHARRIHKRNRAAGAGDRVATTSNAAAAASSSNSVFASFEQHEPQSFACSTAFRSRPRGPLVLCLPPMDSASLAGLPPPPPSARETETGTTTRRPATIAGERQVQRQPQITAIQMRNSNALLVSVCVDSDTDESDSFAEQSAAAYQPIASVPSAAAIASGSACGTASQPNNEISTEPVSRVPNAAACALASSDIDLNQSISSSTIAMQKHSCFCGLYNPSSTSSTKQSSRQTTSACAEGEAGGNSCDSKRQRTSTGGLRGLLPSFFSRGRTPGAKRTARSGRSGSLPRDSSSRRHQRHLSDQLPVQQLPKSRTWNEDMQAQTQPHRSDVSVSPRPEHAVCTSTSASSATRFQSSIEPTSSGRRRSASTASSTSGVPVSCSAAGTSLRSLGRSLVSRVLFTSATSSSASASASSRPSASAAAPAQSDASTATNAKSSYARHEHSARGTCSSRAHAEAESPPTARAAPGSSSPKGGAGAESKQTLFQFLRDKKNELFARSAGKSKEHLASSDAPASERLGVRCTQRSPQESPAPAVRHVHYMTDELHSATASAAAGSPIPSRGIALQHPKIREDFSVGRPSAFGVAPPPPSQATGVGSDGLSDSEVPDASDSNAIRVGIGCTSVYPGFRGRMQLSVDELPLPPLLRRYLMLELD